MTQKWHGWQKTRNHLISLAVFYDMFFLPKFFGKWLTVAIFSFSVVSAIDRPNIFLDKLDSSVILDYDR